MKRIFLVLNIIFISISLFAQTDEDIITLIKNGVYAEKEGDLQHAINYFEQSKDGLEKMKKTDEKIYIIVSYKLAICYSRKGDIVNVENNIKIGSKVLDILKEEDPQFVVFAHNLADCYYVIGNYLRAIEISNKALEICKEIKGETNQDYLRVLRNTSHYYYKNGDYSKAIELYTKELNLIRIINGENNSDYATALNHLANCYSDIGDYPHAIEYGTKALEIRKSVLGENHPDYAETLSNLTTYCNYLNDYPRAIEYGTKALEIRKSVLGENHPDYATSLNNLAYSYYGTNNYTKAIDLGTKAIEIEKNNSSENSNSYAIYLNNLALYNSFEGNNSKAIELCSKALEICKSNRGEVSPEYSVTLANLALYYSYSEDFVKAKKLGIDALNIQKKVTGDKHPQYMALLRFVAICDIFLGNYRNALNNVTKSISLCNSNILQFFSGLSSHQRSSYWQSVSYLFTDLFPSMSYQAHSNNIEDLYNQSALFAKGILLSTDMEMRKLILESDDSLLIAKYKNLSSNLSVYNKLIEKPIKERFMNADSLNRIIEQQEMVLARESRAYGDYTHNLTINWKDVQRRLGDKDIAIEFLDFPIFNTDSTMYVALTLRKDYDCPHLVTLFEEKQLKSIPENDYYTQMDVSNLVWRPLEEELKGVKNIYFSPSGELHRIGIEYLPISKTENICDIYTLHRLSSTRQLAVIQDESKGKNTIIYGGINYDEKSKAISTDSTSTKGAVLRSVFSFRANVDSLSLRNSYDYLEGTKKEADMIAKDLEQHLVPYIYYSGTDGTEESFKKLDGTRPKMMHIATHGFYFTEAEAQKSQFAGTEIELLNDGGLQAGRIVEQKPMTRSGLLFSGCNRTVCHERVPDEEEDGILTAQEISMLDLRGLDLVVLSACQTGLGDIISGEGVFGLQRGFKKAGAKTIIMSLWNVNDESTMKMMTSFYHHYLEGMSKENAFRAAQEELRKDSPYQQERPDWASFIMLDGLN
jgi:CHAT domain-containing protein/lipopolysaccharide biosynthesis regulator YciM